MDGFPQSRLHGFVCASFWSRHVIVEELLELAFCCVRLLSRSSWLALCVTGLLPLCLYLYMDFLDKGPSLASTYGAVGDYHLFAWMAWMFLSFGRFAVLRLPVLGAWLVLVLCACCLLPPCSTTTSSLELVLFFVNVAFGRFAVLRLPALAAWLVLVLRERCLWPPYGTTTFCLWRVACAGSP